MLSRNSWSIWGGINLGTTVNGSVGVDGVGKWGKCKMTKDIGVHRDGV